MEWFSVYLQARAPEDGNTDDLHPPLTEAVANTLVNLAASKLTDLLDYFHGVVAADAHSWEATISIRSIMPATAASVGGAIIQDRASRAGMPDWPIVRIEAVRHDVLDEEMPAEEQERKDRHE